MDVQAKIINMLLYDGTLEGVIRIEDSNWNSGELFASPRDSISDLLSTGACNKYGVYLLLSQDMVYIGQSFDLSKRLTQHMTGKDWWDRAIILTTSNDGLTHSDIDFLESVLIDKAFKTKKLDCENKKNGNPPKVDVFREVYLKQYLKEALFLMELIGVRVFTENKQITRKKKADRGQPIVISVPPAMREQTLPVLPDKQKKIGEFVKEALRNLESNGYIFTDNQIDQMCTPEWSTEKFHTKKPFMKIYESGLNSNKGADGYIRFWKDPFIFGNKKVLISKEWYENQKDYFIAWYESLRGR